MNIVITGGAGFLGDLLASSLLSHYNDISSLKLVDIKEHHSPSTKDKRVSYYCADLSVHNSLNSIITTQTTHVFHLAAIVSSHAESDFDLGIKINVKATELLLEHCRKTNPSIRFIFSSSLAVFGGMLPEVISMDTATQPTSSYGTQKAMCELLVNDYARKGFVDAVTLRLPTICIRPGSPNMAASSFVSGLIREPLNKQVTNCPVDLDLPLWVSSPECVIQNFIHATRLETNLLNGFKCINLPGIQTIPKQMLQSLEKLTTPEIKQFVTFDKNQSIEAIVASWPKMIDSTQALSLGFIKDTDFNSILLNFIQKFHPELKEY